MQKGPYFNQVQYISPLPEGYLQTAANIGNTYANAFRQVGADIGEGIKKYQQNKQQREDNQQVFQTEIAPAIARIHNAVNVAQNNPDDPSARLAGYANDDRVKALLPQLEKFDSLSTSAQNKFLDSARNAMTSIERDELRNYTRDLEQQKLGLEKANFFLRAASDIESGKRADAQLANEGERLKLDQQKTEADIKHTNAQTDALKQPKAVAPESPLGKLIQDRNVAFQRGDGEAAGAIQQQINAEVAKAQQDVAAGKPLSQDQSNALQFALRLRQNEEFIQGNKYDARAFFNGSWTPERFQDDEKKAYDSAKNNWIAAALRKESGAAISADEYKQYDKQYFPQPGDGDKTIAQKSAMRAQLYSGMVDTIGPNAQQHMAAAKYEPTKQTPRFQSESDALASGKKGVVEIYDQKTKKWRKAELN